MGYTWVNEDVNQIVSRKKTVCNDLPKPCMHVLAVHLFCVQSTLMSCQDVEPVLRVLLEDTKPHNRWDLSQQPLGHKLGTLLNELQCSAKTIYV